MIFSTGTDRTQEHSFRRLKSKTGLSVPSQKKIFFIVGEAYQPIKGWIEGALQSAQNALSEGWGIENYSHLGQGRESKQDKGDDNFDLIPFP